LKVELPNIPIKKNMSTEGNVQQKT
jgi:hypothetical protein